MKNNYFTTFIKYNRVFLRAPDVCDNEYFKMLIKSYRYHVPL